MATETATAGPSRPYRTRGPDTWSPQRYLDPPHPDNEEVLEQAAYQAAVTKHGGDTRKTRYKPRKTVDWQGGVIKWRQLSKVRGIGDCLPAIHPSPSDLIGVNCKFHFGQTGYTLVEDCSLLIL